jgi:hypothetical protein
MNINIITLLYDSDDNRIEYFKKYISSIQNGYNLDNVKFFFFVEPNSERMVNMIPPKWNKDIFRNYYRFKPALSHYIAFNYCFDVLNLDHCFLIEDDIIVSPDIFNMIDFWRKSCHFNDHVLCTLNKHNLYYPTDNLYNKPDSSELIKLYNVKYLSCWGSGFSSHFWKNIMKPMWKMNMTFDATINNYYPDIKVLSPVISRSNQIGKSGLNYNETMWNCHGFDRLSISEHHFGKYKIKDANYT